MFRLLLSSLAHHRGINVAVVLGVAVAVAVLAGALLVGASVRNSLRDIALSRLGATDLVVSSTSFFRAALASEIGADSEVTAAFRAVAPLIALDGALVHEDSQRVAARVQVFGVDSRFGTFHGHDAFAITGRDALLSPALAAELGAIVNDSLVLRVAKPTDIPLGTLQGRREQAGERIRLVAKAVLDRESLGDFSLMPAQGPTLSLFVPIERLQRDLGLGDRVNVLLFATEADDDARADLVERGHSAIRKHLRLDDLGLSVRSSHDRRAIVLENRAGVIPATITDRATAAAPALGASVQPALAYLANTIRIGTREVPYSLVAAVDLPSISDTPSLPSTLGTSRTSNTLGTLDPIWLNDWAAADLEANPGDEVTLDYYLWSDGTGLSTDSARFTLAGILPMSGLGGDRTLVPEYPGITDAGDVSTWDPPFPVDMKRVRPRDEQYWDDWRTAPKAFVPLAVGQRLWPSAFGSISSLRFTVPQDGDADQFTSRVTTTLVSSIDPFSTGFAIRDARGDALASATGTTDFGEYFVYFSFFLLVAGLLLAGMFFAMGVEQRTREIGLLGALGFAPRSLRSLLLREAVILIAIGSVLGAIAAVGYAALIMYGLRTWWVGAVGTTALELHVSPLTLIAGTIGAFVAAIVALRLSLRRLLRRSPRDLLAGDVEAPIDQGSASRATVRAWGAVTLGIIAIAFAAASTFGLIGQVAGFFACGGLLLIAGLMAYSAWLWTVTPHKGVPYTAASATVAQLGMQYSRWRPARSVLSAALIAFACFVLVAVGAFRRDHVGESLAHDSGTGGFALMAESVAPLMYDPNTREGREDLGLAPDSPALAHTQISRFRLRPGDEVSCLTLYRPTSPRIIAPEPRFLDERRFSFAASVATTAEERANPWLLLNRQFDDGAIAAVVDQTSLMYVFHLALGDDFTFTPEGQSPVRLRIVGALADSVLQSEMIIGEGAFVRLFPRHEGYRLWLVQTPPSNVVTLATELERSLSDFGVDTTDTRVRLAAYHQVENTYLSTFQTLGGLGLLVGTLGLAAVLARNVLERRRELGLLGAVGFEPRHLRTIVLAESGVLVGGGLLLGTVAALVAVWPAIVERAQSLPYTSLAVMLVAVAFTGLVAATLAVRIATRMSITDAIRSE